MMVSSGNYESSPASMDTAVLDELLLALQATIQPGSLPPELTYRMSPAAARATVVAQAICELCRQPPSERPAAPWLSPAAVRPHIRQHIASTEAARQPHSLEGMESLGLSRQRPLYPQIGLTAALAERQQLHEAGNPGDDRLATSLHNALAGFCLAAYSAEELPQAG